MALMSVQQFQTTTAKAHSFRRGSLSKIDAALEYYHQKQGIAVSTQEKVNILNAVFLACLRWMQKKQGNAEFTTNKLGFKTNYYDQDFLARRTAVKNLGNEALTEMYTVLSNAGILTVEQSGLIKFDKNKLQMLATRQALRPTTKPLESSYSYERESYVKSGKTQAISGSAVHATHKQANQMINQLNLNSKTSSVLDKNVDTLSPQDWLLLNELGKVQEINQTADVIYKKKRDRLNMMVTPDAQGRLLDAHDALFSSRDGQPAIFAMDRYGNLFIEPPDFSTEGNFFNHSSFNSGNEVICAGEMKVQQGILQTINNGSGHYKPTRANLHECVKILNQQSVDLTQAQVTVVGVTPPPTVSAVTFVTTG